MSEFHEIKEKLIKLEERQQVNTERIENIDTKINHIYKLISGNGHIGIFSKVEILWKGGIFIVITIVGILTTMFIK